MRLATGKTNGAMEGLLARVSRLLGLDRAIVFTVLARGWSSIAGIGTLSLVAGFLTPAEQGYYYTFYSLVALQIVFELGFSTVILQTASHEAAHLAIAADGSVEGSRRAYARLASLLRTLVRWYSIAALTMAALVLPAGIYFFHTQTALHASGQPVKWVLPWAFVIAATTCTFQVDPLFSYLEGCGQVAQVARTRLVQAVLGTAMGWVALLLHHGLFAPGLMILGQALAGAGYVYSKRRFLLPLLKHPSGEDRIGWGAEIWPFQWRIAVSWLCGYLIFQLFNPILFHYRGPVEAGRMGMSTNICGTLSSMAVAWMNTKAAPFGQMIARREYASLDRLFFRALAQSTSIAALAFGAVFSAVILLRAHRFGFAMRLLGPAPLAMLFGASVLNVIVFSEALYLRAHKQEKFMMISVASALWMAPGTVLLGRTYGASGIAAWYLLGGLLIGVGYGTFTFLKWRRLWHTA